MPTPSTASLKFAVDNSSFFAILVAAFFVLRVGFVPRRISVSYDADRHESNSPRHHRRQPAHCRERVAAVLAFVADPVIIFFL